MTVGELLAELEKVDRHLPVTVQVPAIEGAEDDSTLVRRTHYAQFVEETGFPGVGRLLVIGLER